ncbi:hypothetical protein KAR34_12335 [bacterium]|nr:hypothetical protein [bacterium]
MDPYSTQMLMLNQLGQLGNSFVEHIRSVLIALVLIVVGLIVAEIAKHISVVLLRVFRWNRFSVWTGLTQIMQKVRADVNSAVLIGEFLFWLIFISFLMKAFIVTGINSVSGLGRVYFDHIGSVFQAALILALAGIISQWLAKAILLIVDHAAAWYASAIGRTLVLTLGAYTAILGLGVDRDLVLFMGLILFAGVMLALALQWNRNVGSVYQHVVRVEDGEKGL